MVDNGGKGVKLGVTGCCGMTPGSLLGEVGLAGLILRAADAFW
jgi:hypothetical protein